MFACFIVQKINLKIVFYIAIGLYVVSTKMSGFSMEVINSDPNMVICGIRVLLGSQDVARTPSFVEVRIFLLFTENKAFTNTY